MFSPNIDQILLTLGKTNDTYFADFAVPESLAASSAEPFVAPPSPKISNRFACNTLNIPSTSQKKFQSEYHEYCFSFKCSC